MISFRYFLTSLIAVFLALAVGIVLGAGPLKEAIGNTLTGRVDQLTAQVDELETSLADVSEDLTSAEQFVADSAAVLVPNTLTERRIAVLSLGAQDELVTQVTSAVSAAGGEVTTVVRIESGWSDEAKASFRQQLASTMPTYLDPVPPVGATSDAVLAQALVQALTATDPSDPNVPRLNSDLVMELLLNAELVTIQQPTTLPVDAVLIVGSPAGGLESAAAAAPWVALATESATIVPTAVVTGTEVALAGALQEDASGTVTTVTGADTVSGAVTVPLALGSTIAGTIGHYGPGATAVPPRVVLEPPVRVPTPVTVAPPADEPPAEPPAEGGEAPADGDQPPAEG